MRKITLFLFFLLTFFVYSANSSLAFDLKSSTEINISNNDSLEENLYLFGANITFDSDFKKDLFLVGANNFVKGSFFEDLQLIGLKNYFSGESFGDTRLIGGETIIKGNTNKDLVIVSTRAIIEDGSILNGQTLIVAGEVYLNGEVLDNIKIIAGKVYVNSSILGDVEITAQDVYINNKSDIKGDFVYFSPKRAQIDSGAKIKNELVYNQIESIEENEFVKKTVLSFVNFWSVIKFLATLFTAFILVFVFKMFSQRTSDLAFKKFWKSILIGILSVLLIPIFILILAASLFGLPLAGILFSSYVILFILTAPVSGIILGYYLQKIYKKDKKVEVEFGPTAIGIVLLTFLYFIPWVGNIIKTIFFVLSFGAMVLYYFEIITIKNKKWLL